MNFGELNRQVKIKNAENERDINFIISGLKKDLYDKNRLEKLLFQAEKYKNTHNGKSRGNNNVISACKILLNQGELF